MNNLKNIRKDRDITQPRLAELSGISLRTISRIESGLGNMTQKTGERLAEALGCTYADLVAEPEESRMAQPSREDLMLDLFRSLSPEDQDEIFDLANFKKQRKKKVI